MIIQSVQAERLHKYQSLSLTDLPERGIIAVSGDNETGKSAIGEIICFALFGRTYVLADDRIGKLVHWGAAQGAVTLRFRSGGRTYEAIRHLARDGEQSARLLCPEASSEPLARGNDAVTAEIRRLLGYGFDEFVETFYLAQREITTPHPHSPAFKSMVGIVPYEQCGRELTEEVEREAEAVRLGEGRVAELDDGLSALGSEHERLDDLERELVETADREQELSDRLHALEAAADAYCRDCRGQRGHAFRKGLAGFLSTLILLAVLLGAGLWAMLKYEPQLWPMPFLREHLEKFAGGLGMTLDAAMLYAAIAIGGILLLIWLWMFFLHLGTRKRRARARRLADELELIDGLEPGPRFDPEVGEDALAEGEVRLEEAPGLVDKPDSERRARLQERVLALTVKDDELRAALKHETTWLTSRLEQLSTQREETEAVLDRARADEEAFRRLSDQKVELEANLAEHRERIATLRLARELLDGATKQMSEQFSEHLRTMVSKALPQFTEGRYEHLQVDDALQVRVYSPDKRNLLDLDEISSGTQRQIMLALRLGLGQELVSRLVRETQFAFLDEPFAFFDTTRMRNALKTLVELGGDVVQYWVVAQRFPQDAHIGLEVACGRHPDTLEVGRPQTS